MSDGSSMSGHYNLVFVALSVFIAVLSAYAALDLAGRVASSRRTATRLAWLGGGAVAMGIGIWSMHYIGMLALRMPMPMLYDWPTVLLSLIAAIFASAIALSLVSRKTMGIFTTIGGSICMGAAIAGMHYIGMAAMRMPATIAYSIRLVAASIVLAIVISFVALRLTFATRHITKMWTWQKGLSALLMGFAIPVMHYTGMAAARFAPAPLSADRLLHSVSISDLGAASIALVTVVMLCLVFLSAMVDRHFSHQARELEGSEERYRRILSATFDAFLGIGSDGRITDWNAQAERTFGWLTDEAIGRPVQEMIQIEDGAEDLSTMLQAACGASIQGRMEVTARHKSGRQFPAEMALSVITIEENRLLAAFVHDVTERKMAERHMAESRRSAEDANRAKSEFLANMSHEIRTPLNGVIGMTDLALETELTREQREYLETVKLSADSLLSVINDILDFSKIEAGKVDLEEIRFDVRDCLESTLKTLALRADEKDLELLCDISPGVPDALMGDAGRLRQIVVNLIGNAIKFTSAGEVSLHVRTEQGEHGNDELHCTISDTGVGIAPEKLETIFEKFSQADTSTTRVYGGTGLGLTISRRLIELMGGRIWIDSELGKGSHFHFRIPLRPAESLRKAPELDDAHRILHGVKVLIIDDNKTNRRILEGLLKGWGMVPTCVADGPGALRDLVTMSRSGGQYGLILTDMHMPHMDGFGVVQHINDTPDLSAATIMMLSSGGHRGDAQRCQELGIAAYLLKPVRQAELREAITRVLQGDTLHGNTKMITANTLRSDRASNQLLSVLLAEDNPVNQKLAVRLLEKRGHTVTVVDNGRQAVEAVERQSFDLLLMDVQMPEMDGITATTNIRAREEKTGRHQPIVAMTALVMKGDRERCLAARMDGYLSKPIRAQDLDEILEMYIARKQETTPRATEALAEVTEPADESPAVNLQDLLDRIDGDTDFVAELADIFREDSPRQTLIVRACIAGRDPEGLKRGAHALKGALANLSAVYAASLAARIEQIAASGTVDGAAGVLATLEGELPRVLAALDAVCAEQVR